MSKKRKSCPVCQWCGTPIDPMRSSRTKFCNASHRAMWWRRGQIVQDKTDRAEKAVNAVGELLAFDDCNDHATRGLKWLKDHIEFILENGYQLSLPGTEGDMYDQVD